MENFANMLHVLTTETRRTRRNSDLSFAVRYRQMKGVTLPASKILIDRIGGVDSFVEQRRPMMTEIGFRHRRTSNLPIRGISREWAKTLFSVSSLPLW
jgi:hypothetical protein